MAFAGIDIVQLHGDEDNDYMEAVAKPIMSASNRAFSVQNQSFLAYLRAELALLVCVPQEGSACARGCDNVELPLTNADFVLKTVIYIAISGTTVDMVMDHPAMAEGGRNYDSIQTHTQHRNPFI